MSVHYMRPSLLILSGLILASNAFAGTKTMNWPVYQANAIEYYQSKLPYAIVIYVYASPGNLIGIINPHGHSDQKSMKDLSERIASQKFTRLAKAKRVSLEKSLKAFLLDQGYKTNNIVKSQSKYTLLLTMPKVKKSDCAAYLGVERKFKQVIRNSIQKESNGNPLYSVAVLELSSPKSHITCAK